MDIDMEPELLLKNSASSEEQEEDWGAQLLVFYPNRQSVPYKLHWGVNVVGRQSSFAQRDSNRLHDWSAEYSGANVHGIFLESSSVSSAHAVIYLEDWGERCYVKDLKSRNKTFIKRGNKHTAVEPDKKVPLQSGSSLTFGALKCRVTFGPNSTEDTMTPLGVSPVQQSQLLSTHTRAVSIGQRTVPPLPGRPTSLDKCPSLQEWFQRPAKLNSREKLPALARAGSRGSQGEGEGSLPNFPQRDSFGFGTVDPEERTSSDGEPETPRIDRPAIRSPAHRSPRSPFSAERPVLDPMMEDEREDATQASPPTPAPDDAPQASGQEDKLSMEMGAATLAQLRSFSPAPMQPAAGTSPPKVCSPFAIGPGLGFDEMEHTRGRSPRPLGHRKSPPGKRSRSGRIASPDKSLPRSKSPRLQRGFSASNQLGGEHAKLDEIRDAMRGMLT